jgi:hypothetical protein
VDQQRRQEAATIFRGRHHVSQDDTRDSIDDFEELDINGATGPMEVIAEAHAAEVSISLLCLLAYQNIRK